MVQPAPAAGTLPLQTSNPPPETPVPAIPQATEIPPAVAENPVVKDVLSGKIPGVLVRAGMNYPKANELAKDPQVLLDLGMQFYLSQAEDIVVYNPTKISEEELQAAEQQGVLDKIVPDYGIISGEAPEKPSKKEAKAEVTPTKAAKAVPYSTEVLPSTKPPPAKVQNKLATDRLAALNVAKAGPTSGPVPGAGRVVNTLATPAR